MARPVIIPCALTGGAATTQLSPHVPVTPEQIANEGIAAARAGAAVVHIHVRDPKTGKSSMETAYYREVVQRIRDSKVEVLINLTTGSGGNYTPSPEDPRRPTPESSLSTPERRVEHVLELKPDLCSLDIATMNFGEYVFMNTPAHIRRMAQMINESGVKPELEVFDLGQVRLACELIDKGFLKAPALFQLCLGISWGAPATTESMLMMRNLLPRDALWAAFGISRAEFHMAAQAVILGGHVRVGLEDNLYIERGKLSPGNAPLVERAVQIIGSLGEEPASVAQAREILGLG
ncbi:MAG: NADPH:quinone reductase [Betaproteobacteria bacterium RBG_16_64_9]|nr:MAG: NADPH:quinone reductase [Betaproteobacteria bacterium RBG_16_64_9]